VPAVTLLDGPGPLTQPEPAVVGGQETLRIGPGGKAFQVKVRYLLARQGGDWRIDPRQTVPDCRAELESLLKQPSANRAANWTKLRDRLVRQHGLGGFHLALFRFATGPAGRSVRPDS
jgi:hypothetical protein